MNIVMGGNPLRVVLDTNILISAIGFPGKQRQILLLALTRQVESISSAVLLAEFEDVVNKKFPKLRNESEKAIRKIRKKFIIVSPKISVNVSRDKDDNRVLEAAVEGKCDCIITGDKDLLDLGKYKKIKILTADQFLKTEVG